MEPTLFGNVLKIVGSAESLKIDTANKKLIAVFRYINKDVFELMKEPNAVIGTIDNKSISVEQLDYMFSQEVDEHNIPLTSTLAITYQ